MGKLTNAMPSLGGQMFPSGQQAALAGSAQLPSADAILGPDVLNPKSDTSQMPPMIKPKTPSFREASNSGQGGTPNALSPALSTKGKLLTVLLNAAKGAGAGAGSTTFGEGFAHGGELPFIQASQKQALQKGQLESQLAQAQIQNIPFLREQKQVELQKDQAQTGLYQAQTKKAATPESNQQLDLPHLYAQAVQKGDAPGAARYLEAIQDSQKQPAPKEAKEPSRDDRAIAIMAKPEGQWTPEDKAYMHGFNQWVKKTKVDPGAARAEIFVSGRPVQVATDNPGEVIYEPAGKAMKEGARAPASGDVKAAQAVQKSATSGPIGQNLTAFNTAIDHAKQLRSAADALDNGDIRGLNKVGNAMGYQFGSDKMTNFNVIKNALSGEVSKVFKGGQATDAEIHAVQAPFDAANSPQQLKGAIQNAIHLMNSKRDALKKQVEMGMQGKPNYGDAGNNNQPAATHRYNPQTHQIEPI